MVNYHALTSAMNLSGTNVVVVGGTHGIGASIALRFAELGSSVLIMGRSESAGNALVSAMRSTATTEATFTFVRADLGAVDAIRKAADDIAEWAGGLGGGVDYLVQSQGGPAMGIPTTRASATISFNVQILSHFLLPYLLLTRPKPVLRAGAQISNIIRPGEQGKVVNLDDPMGLNILEKGTLAYIRNGLNMMFMVDLFTEEFNRRFPHTRSMHVFPGNVASGSLSGPAFPWYVRLLGALFALFAQTPEAYADVAVWQHASDEWKKKGLAFFDHKGNEVKVDGRVTAEEGEGRVLREGVWAKMLELAGEKQL